MTIRRACPVCWTNWAEPDQTVCAACAVGRTPTAKLLKQLHSTPTTATKPGQQP